MHAPSDTTIVIITRDRAPALDRTLNRLRALPGRPPVIVVDNASSDDTAELVRSRHPDVLLVRSPTNQGASGRTLGARFARSKYVAFNDDDSWWSAASLGAAEDLFDRHPRLGLLAAQVLVGTEERPDGVSEAMARSPLATASDLPGRSVLGFLACACVVRRRPFLELGGFTPLITFMGEETKVAVDFVSAGWGVCYVDALVVHHHPPVRRVDDRREALIARNQVLTAILRRPPSAVFHEARKAFARRDAPSTPGSALYRLAVGTSIARRSLSALSQRKVIAEHVELALRQCAGTPVESDDGARPSQCSSTARPAVFSCDIILRATEHSSDRLLGPRRSWPHGRTIVVDDRRDRRRPLRVAGGVEVMFGSRRGVDDAARVAWPYATADWVLFVQDGWEPAADWADDVARQIAMHTGDAVAGDGQWWQPSERCATWYALRRSRLTLTNGLRAPHVPGMQAPAALVLFDRDGTLVRDVPYNGDPARVTLTSGAQSAVRRLRARGVQVGLVSNQSGVGRGLLIASDVWLVHDRLTELLGPFDVTRYCFHVAEDRCACRKPGAGMVLDAMRALGTSPCETWMIGDIAADLSAAHVAGARAVLVPTDATLPDEVEHAPIVAKDLPAAVELILSAHAVGRPRRRPTLDRRPGRSRLRL